jgi:hypothetical protein
MARRAALVLIAGAMVGCGNEAEMIGPGTSIRIEPASIVLLQLGTRQLEAQLLDAEGRVIPDATFTFTSSHPDLLSVSGSGLVTSIGPSGNGVITASAGSISRDVPVAVTQLATSVAVFPKAISLPPGATIPVSALVADAVGAEMPGAPITLSVAPVSLLSVTNDGQLSAAGGAGAGTLTATSGTISGSVPVTVEPVATLDGTIFESAAIVTTPFAAVIAPDGTVFGIGIGGSLNVGQFGGTSMQAVSFSGSITTGILRHPESGLLYVSGSEADALLEVSPVSRTVLRRWAAPGVQMFDVALSRDGREVYVGGDDGGLHVIDIETMTRRTRIQTTGGIVHLAAHPSLPLVYASGFEKAREINVHTGTVRSFDHPAAQAVALSLSGARLFIGGEQQALGIVTLATGQQTSVPVDCRIYDLVAAPDGRTLLATCPLDGKAVLIDIETAAISATIATGGFPRRAAIKADGTGAVIANESDRYDYVE